jgi:hypothetical protein
LAGNIDILSGSPNELKPYYRDILHHKNGTYQAAEAKSVKRKLRFTKQKTPEARDHFNLE